jgi:hypothetical protein
MNNVTGRSDEEKEFGQLHMFGNFAMRMLVNMVPQATDAAESLAEDLLSMPERYDEFRTAATIHGARLDAHQGSGKRRFECVLELSAGGYGPHGFKMFPKGFGMRARGVERAGRIAVTAYAAFLAGIERPMQGRWDSNVGSIAHDCAARFRSGEVEVLNQHEVVNDVVRSVWAQSA